MSKGHEQESETRHLPVTDAEFAAMAEVFKDPEAAIRNLPEEEQRKYREAQQSVVDARLDRPASGGELPLIGKVSEELSLTLGEDVGSFAGYDTPAVPGGFTEEGHQRSLGIYRRVVDEERGIAPEDVDIPSLME